MKRALVASVGAAAVLALVAGPALCAQTPPEGGSAAARELTARGVAYVRLGRADPTLFREALRAFDAAIAADPSDMEPRIRLAQLFLDKYNSADARATIEQALTIAPNHPGVLLVAARRAMFDGEPGAVALVERSLEANPNVAEARAFLARLHLEVEDYASAAAEAERALALDSASSPALAVLAASHLLRGDRPGFEDARRLARSRGAEDAAFYTTLAELSVRNRMYAEGAAFARDAVRLDSTWWEAYAVLGMNELRTGAVADGRRTLERAFAGDPYNVWVKNTLDLFDVVARYREMPTKRFLIVADPDEAELLSLYAGELAEEAYGTLAARYGYRPATPVRLELYRSHADFSVRAVGLAGLGALGVSFGNVLAMDSPSAREVGAFNWGSTLWHEVAHAFTLGASGHKVPRWLSEGISVLEERRARPGWGAGVSPAFLAAFKAGALPPVSRLNDGFTRPAFPEQVMFSYYQASLVCEMIEQELGARALVQLLHGYRDGLGTEQIFRRVIGMDPRAFDDRFDQYLRRRFAKSLAAVEAHPASRGGSRRAPGEGAIGGQYASALMEGRAHFEAGRHEAALAALERAKSLFPEFASSDGPHWYLALIHEKRGALRKAADELTTLTSIDETHYRGNVELARLLEQLGDPAGAAAALERAIFIHPGEIAVHVKLAELSAGLGERTRAVRERRAVVALGPTDMAEALYQLALAHHEAGDAAAARRAVLRALERAPSFEKAQELLLRLRGAAAGSGSEDGR